MDAHDHKPNKVNLDEKAFKSVYIATFMASYMAAHYEDDCLDGHRSNRHNNQPAEDASYNANLAWEQIQKQL